jgi:LmbE family N-acetylglucosaminyl deacetylase
LKENEPMKLRSPNAEIYVPDGVPIEAALARTTHLGIGAHQDDLEIMAIDGILHCFQRDESWFTGVVVTDGAGSPRNGVYEQFTDAQMQSVRMKEQKKAAMVGDYSAMALLAYPSSVVKDSRQGDPQADLRDLIKSCAPEVVYTHNLADKHPTHVAVALRVIGAIRDLPEGERPKRLYGCEVWRDLGWTLDDDKVVFDCSSGDNLQAALVGLFDSQVAGGKRYDLATMGRRRAHATYYASHGVDTATGLSFGMDLTPLITNPAADIDEYVQGFIDRFSRDVHRLLAQARQAIETNGLPVVNDRKEVG